MGNSFQLTGCNSSQNSFRVRKLEVLEERNLLTWACGLEQYDWHEWECEREEPGSVEQVLEIENARAQNSIAQDAGNFFAHAHEIGTLDSFVVDESVSTTDPRDFYRFELSSNATVDVSITNLTRPAKLLIYDADKNLIGQTSNRGMDERLNLELEQGSYFVRVNHPFRSATNYRLRLLAESTTQPDSPEPPPSQPEVEFPDVPYFGSRFDWNLNAIDAPEVWAQNITGEDVVVAVIDTGVDYFHSDLRDNIWVNAGEIAGNGIDDDNNGFVDDRFGWDFVDDDQSPLDSNGHGTHVAGTIAAERNTFGVTGVAYDASIMPIRVLNTNGSGFLSDVAAGIIYAVDNGADVINLSLGGGGHSTQIFSALQYALDNDVFVSVAAGNESSAVPGFPARYSSVLDNVLSVGAHDSRNVAASFSNEVGLSRSVQVDAPGVSIASTYPQDRYRLLNGTSMAAPHVSGLAALILSARPDLSSVQVRNLITSGVSAGSILGSDSIGSINARASLEATLQVA